jgi:hypothetical protein
LLNTKRNLTYIRPHLSKGKKMEKAAAGEVGEQLEKAAAGEVLMEEDDGGGNAIAQLC